MTNLNDLAADAATRATGYRRCPPEQALVYGCEDVLERQLPSREVVDADDRRLIVEAVCEAEGIDTPKIGDLRRRTSSRRRVVATADIDADEIRFESTGTTMSTILHELAHLVSGMDDHGPLFRDTYVRLLRRHCDVGRAAMLHGLFVLNGLDVAPWPASAR